MESKPSVPGTEELYAGQSYNESIDTALATIHESQLQLSIMGDSKANIMITVCSILLTLAIAKIEQGELVLPLSLFTVCCIPALVFAIMTVLPTAPLQRKQVSDISSLPRFNPLFFLHFSLVPLKVFEREIERVLRSPQALYLGLSRDIYFAGVEISTKKFRYLRWSYLSLLAGLALGSVAIVGVLVL